MWRTWQELELVRAKLLEAVMRRRCYETHPTVKSMLRGEPGTSVTLTVQRDGSPEPTLRVPVSRKLVRLPDSIVFRDDVGAPPAYSSTEVEPSRSKTRTPESCTAELPVSPSER